MDGRLVVNYSYDAWGNPGTPEINNPAYAANTLLHEVVTINPFRYRGYLYDSETGLDYLRSRFYDPETGRFLSPDSIDYLEPTDPQGLNLYAYCDNDPINRCDYTGENWSWNTFWKGVGLTVTAIGAIALSVTTFGAGIPLAMSVVAGITLSAGILTGINGIATMIEAGTQYNIVRDGVFNNLGWSDSAYDTYEGVTEGIAIIGSLILGFYHTTGQYKAAKESQEFLGKGYSKAGKNRWVSNDGLRQVRWDTTHHRVDGIKTKNHFNWDFYNSPIGPGIREKPFKKIHFYLKWFSFYSK